MLNWQGPKLGGQVGHIAFTSPPGLPLASTRRSKPLIQPILTLGVKVKAQLIFELFLHISFQEAHGRGITGPEQDLCTPGSPGYIITVNAPPPWQPSIPQQLSFHLPGKPALHANRGIITGPKFLDSGENG